MRTKTLLLTAALGLLGAVSSFAQVYSVNAVGYVNKSLTGPGYLLVENPLNNGNNQIGTVIPGGVPDGTYVQQWDVATQDFKPQLTFQAGDWYTPDFQLATAVLAPGEGFFLFIPSNPGETVTVTFIGDVPQGSLSLPLAGDSVYNLIGSQVPQSASFSDLGLTSTIAAGGAASDGTYAQFWDVASQDFFPQVTFQSGAWYTPDFQEVNPTPEVGEAWFLFVTGPSTSWDRNFSVNP